MKYLICIIICFSSITSFCQEALKRSINSVNLQKEWDSSLADSSSTVTFSLRSLPDSSSIIDLQVIDKLNNLLSSTYHFYLSSPHLSSPETWYEAQDSVYNFFIHHLSLHSDNVILVYIQDRYRTLLEERKLIPINPTIEK